MQIVTVCVMLMFAALALTIRAQDTNALKTEIGNFEAQTNTIIVKGFDELGHVYANAATVTVLCKETSDITHGRKEYGAALEVAEGPDPGQFAIVDEDELDSLLTGLDYLAQLRHDVTTLPAFEAEDTTKFGLRFVGYCLRQDNGIRYYLQICDGRKVDLTSDQVKQLADLIDKARDSIKKLRGTKGAGG
jgi:hypothetical protein